jgi:thioredoxin-related protein
VALRSGTNDEVQNHLLNKKLTWSVVNDPQGKIAQTYGVKVVPAIFFLNKEGHIVFTSVGYSTEWGLRLRAWLAGFL